MVDEPTFRAQSLNFLYAQFKALFMTDSCRVCMITSSDHEPLIPPGSLIVADEASMISITHLATLTEYAARNGCKLLLAGDQEQLAAVEGGGAMMLLADRLGYVQLAEPVRFTAAWERAASFRLRAGDATALSPCSPTQFGAARSGALHSLPLLFRLFKIPWGGRLGRGNDDRDREGIRRDEVAGLDFGPVR
jgi:AAA domain